MQRGEGSLGAIPCARTGVCVAIPGIPPWGTGATRFGLTGGAEVPALPGPLCLAKAGPAAPRVCPALGGCPVSRGGPGSPHGAPCRPRHTWRELQGRAPPALRSPVRSSADESCSPELGWGLLHACRASSCLSEHRPPARGGCAGGRTTPAPWAEHER